MPDNVYIMFYNSHFSIDRVQEKFNSTVGNEGKGVDLTALLYSSRIITSTHNCRDATVYPFGCQGTAEKI